jgi:hypothetical protein
MAAARHYPVEYAISPQYHLICGFRKLQPDAIIPVKGSYMAAGFDLHSPVPFEIPGR